MKRFVIIILILLMCMLVIFPLCSYASGSDLRDLNAYGGGNGGSSTKLESMAERILGVIQVIGIVVSVSMLIAIGIKYMVGSLEERAEYKKTMMPYIIGALFVFGITNILGIVSNITNGLL